MKISDTVGEVVKGFSGHPMLLALLVLNGLGIGVGVWYLHAANARNAELFTLLLKSCLPER